MSTPQTLEREMTEITINDDRTLSVKWTGQRGRGSLYHIGAVGDVAKVNALDIKQLVAVHQSAKSAPFPLGNGENVYRMVIKYLDENPGMIKEDINLGTLRKAILERAANGCNAPYDSYLAIAYDIATGKTPVHNY